MTKNIEAEYDKQLSKFGDKSARSGDVCVSATFIALSDPGVRAKFVEKIAEGYVFIGIHCDPSGIFEHVTVVFEFRCPDGVFCLIPPTFAATVDIIGGTVTAIHDPYFRRRASVQSRPLVGVAFTDGTYIGNG